MTNEQRNIKLKHLIKCMKCEASGKVCDENCPTQYEAGNVGEIIENLEAISEMLEQQPCEDWYDVPSDEMTFEQAKQAVKDLRKKLAEYLEQQPCDMKQRVEKEYLYESLCEDLKKANAEIKRLSEPFEDAISRQAVDELSKELVHTTRDKADFLCNFWEGLQKLPPVTPKEKIGKWMKYSIPRCGEQHYQCTSCGYYINFGQWGEVYTKQFKYCPNCKAKMIEPQESEKINCKSTKCKNCINHNYCDFEPQESEDKE